MKSLVTHHLVVLKILTPTTLVRLISPSGKKDIAYNEETRAKAFEGPCSHIGKTMSHMGGGTCGNFFSLVVAQREGEGKEKKESCNRCLEDT